MKWPLLALLALAAGCARVSTTTSIHADGSFTRKVVYTVAKANALSSMGGANSGEGKESKQKPEDFFKLPISDGNVKVTKSEEKDNLLVTVSREVPAGSPPLQDITLWAEKGKVMATSSVVVNKLANGQIEYVETLHGVSPSLVPKDFIIPDLRARIKKALPEEFQKTELIDRLTHDVMTNMGRALMGPPSPALMGFFLDTEGTARRVNGIVFEADIRTLKADIPSLTDDQARAISRSLTNIFNPDSLNQSSSGGPPSASKEGGDGSDMTPLFFAVSFPGKVVETNGLTDPVSGEVYWSLLPLSLGLGDVQLRVVVQP